MTPTGASLAGQDLAQTECTGCIRISNGHRQKAARSWQLESGTKAVEAAPLLCLAFEQQLLLLKVLGTPGHCNYLLGRL